MHSGMNPTAFNLNFRRICLLPKEFKKFIYIFFFLKRELSKLVNIVKVIWLLNLHKTFRSMVSVAGSLTPLSAEHSVHQMGLDFSLISFYIKLQVIDFFTVKTDILTTNCLKTEYRSLKLVISVGKVVTLLVQSVWKLGSENICIQMRTLTGLLHRIDGGGLPSPRHLNVTESPFRAWIRPSSGNRRTLAGSRHQTTVSFLSFFRDDDILIFFLN